MESFVPEKIELTNYVCFSDIAFEIKPGKHLICGANGSGKSTLLSDSILSALYNKGRSQDQIFKEDKAASIKVHFSSGENKYIVERLFPDNSRRSPIITLNGEPLNHKKSSLRQAEIEKILGVSYDIFARTIVVRQDMVTNFGILTPTMRKGLIEELVGYSIWDQMKKPFAKQSKIKFGEVSLLVGKTNEETNKMVSLNSKIETLKNVDEDKLENIKRIEGQLGEINTSLRGLEVKIKAIHEKFPKLAIEDRIYKNLLQLKNQLSQAQHIVNTANCPTCKQAYPEDLMESCRNTVSDLSSKVEVIQSTYDQIAKVRDVLSKLNNDRVILSQKKSSLEASKNNYSKDYNFDEMGEDLKKITSDVNNLKIDLEEAKKSGDNIKYIESQLTPSSSFRTGVLSDQIKAIEELANEIKKTIFPEIEVCLDLNEKGVGFKLKREGKYQDYMVFSGGQKRRIDIIMIFAFQKFLSDHSGIISSFIVLDEIFDGLDLNGINDILNTIDILYPNAKSIYVISHKEEIKQAFNSVTRIASGPDGSYLHASEGYET